MARSATTHELGLAAERRAAAFLEARGLEVLARNVRCRIGELDLVCRDARILVIVEVRQRSAADFGGAAASVTARKQRQVVRTASYCWQRNPSWRLCPLRFDVVALQNRDGEETIDWIQDAFR